MAKLPLFLLAVPFIATGAPAMAAEDGAGRQVMVPYGDLDLASADGRRKLTARVRRATYEVCGGRSTVRLNLNEVLAYRECRAAAMRSAEPQLASLFSGQKLADGGPLHVAAN
ncbi:UrcA family protein [Sphingopyxis sp. NJF-3]